MNEQTESAALRELVEALNTQWRLMASGHISGKYVELRGWHEDDIRPALDRARAAIKLGDAVQGAEGGGWQPIETAPKGAGEYSWMYLAWGPEGDQNTGVGMRWGDKFFAAPPFYCLGQERKYAFREIEIHPTHWQPRPAPPSSPTAGEQS